MSESKVSRTLVKSSPELWSEVSSAASLQRHMDQFGEIRITKLEPETAVAWEGERARGTITLESSGWGTKVSLTASPTDRVDPEPARATSIDLPPEVAETEMRELETSLEHDKRVGEVGKRRWTRRLALAVRKWFRPGPLDDTEPAGAAPVAPSEPEQPATPAPVAAAELAPQPRATPSELATVPTAALDAALNSLGQAHHRPYSRS